MQSHEHYFGLPLFTDFSGTLRRKTLVASEVYHVNTTANGRVERITR